jgi:hypothetical protein
MMVWEAPEGLGGIKIKFFGIERFTLFKLKDDSIFSLIINDFYPIILP